MLRLARHWLLSALVVATGLSAWAAESSGAKAQAQAIQAHGMVEPDRGLVTVALYPYVADALGYCLEGFACKPRRPFLRSIQT